MFSLLNNCHSQPPKKNCIYALSKLLLNYFPPTSFINLNSYFMPPPSPFQPTPFFFLNIIRWIIMLYLCLDAIVWKCRGIWCLLYAGIKKNQSVGLVSDVSPFLYNHFTYFLSSIPLPPSWWIAQSLGFLQMEVREEISLLHWKHGKKN